MTKDIEINSYEFIEIFKKNFDYPIIKTPIGKGVKMDAYNAFIYTSVTGAGYFDNPYYPFTPKGLLKVFYNAFDYNFVTGIFDHSALKNTPLYMSYSMDFLFNGDKFIIPVEFEKETELQKYLEKCEKILKEKNLKSTDYIIQRIEKRKKGNGMEPFMEYLTAETFKKVGFIVENQIPLAHNIGSPDFGGYSLALLNNVNIANKYFQGGFHIFELSLIRLFKEKFSSLHTNSLNNNLAIVGEAKTSTKKMKEQLLKYLNTNLFYSGYEIHPSKPKPSEEYFGLLTLSSNLEIIVSNPIIPYTNPSNPLDKENYYKWLENYIKYYLIGNFTNDELNEIFEITQGYPISSSQDIINFTNMLSVDEIFELIKNIG